MKNPKGQQYATSRPAVCNLTGNKGTIQVISSDFDKKENLRKERIIKHGGFQAVHFHTNN